MFRYLPIGTVAALEGYFRLVFRDLIEHGPPYRDNARNLDDVRLDVGTMLAMGRQHVSLGEIVGHLLPVSSLEDIIRHMSVLLGRDFVELIKRTGFGNATLAEVMPMFMQNVRQLYYYRHVFCHELAVKIKPTIESIDRSVVMGLALAYSTEQVVVPLLRLRSTLVKHDILVDQIQDATRKGGRSPHARRGGLLQNQVRRP